MNEPIAGSGISKLTIKPSYRYDKFTPCCTDNYRIVNFK